MNFFVLLASLLFTLHAHAATSCLAFMKNSQGGSAGNFPRQTIAEPEKELWSFDGISVTVIPATKESSGNIAVSIVNDGRKQLLAGETVWMSGEFLAKSQEAYWILVDCEPVGGKRRK